MGRPRNGQQQAPQSALAPSDNAFRALIRSFGLLKRVMEPYFVKFGISGSQWAVLRTLRRSEQAGDRNLRLTDLCDRLLVRPPSVTGVVDRLQRMGLVRRTASTTDQRAKHVKLTPAGRKLVERILSKHDDQIGKVLGGLSAPEQERLRGLLDRLSSRLNAMTQEDDEASR